jgi:hypothetical protein
MRRSSQEYTIEITLEEVDLIVEYNYEAFDRYEYELTGYRGGIEIESVRVSDKQVDITGLLTRKDIYSIIEEKVLETHENVYE